MRAHITTNPSTVTHQGRNLTLRPPLQCASYGQTATQKQNNKTEYGQNNQMKNGISDITDCCISRESVMEESRHYICLTL